MYIVIFIVYFPLFDTPNLTTIPSYFASLCLIILSTTKWVNSGRWLAKWPRFHVMKASQNHIQPVTRRGRLWHMPRSQRWALYRSLCLGFTRVSRLKCSKVNAKTVRTLAEKRRKSWEESVKEVKWERGSFSFNWFSSGFWHFPFHSEMVLMDVKVSLENGGKVQKMDSKYQQSERN